MDPAQKLRLQSHYKGLFGFALTLAGSEDEARDLVQETAMKALGAVNVPEDATAFRVWLFRILHNSWRDGLRRHDNRPKAPLDDLDRSVQFGEWVTVHEQRINVMAVRSSLGKLSAEHQQVIAMIDVAGLKYAEAGEVLQVPTGTIMSRLARARHALMSAMNEATVIPISSATRRAKTL